MKLATLMAVLALSGAAFAEQAAPAAAKAAPAAPAVAATPAAAPAAAKPAPGPRRMPRSMMNRPFDMGMGRDPVVQFATSPHAAKAIGLTDEQQAKIREINKSSHEKMKDLQKQQHAATEKQRTLMQAEKPDEAAVMAAIDATFEARKAITKEQTKTMFALKAVLTPEQLAKATEELKNMRMRGRRGPVAKPEAKPAEKPAEAKPAEAKPAEAKK